MEYFNNLFYVAGLRACGKTTSAILNADLFGYNTIVMATPEYGRMKAEEYGVKGLTFISYKEFIEKGCDQLFVIDEIDNFLLFLNKNYRGHTKTTIDLFSNRQEKKKKNVRM